MRLYPSTVCSLIKPMSVVYIFTHVGEQIFRLERLCIFLLRTSHDGHRRKIAVPRMKQLLVILGLAAFILTWLSYSSIEIVGDSNAKSPHTSLTQRLRRLGSLAAKSSSNGVRNNQSQQSFKADNQTCEPKSHVFFLKTHKCASSTVQNILMRYAERYDLSLVLPPVRNYLGHPEPFHKELALPPANKTYDMFCHHTRFHPKHVAEVMPKDTLYLTIVRDPVTMFESLFSYYDLAQKWGVDLANIPPKSNVKLTRASEGKFGRNQMLFDLGMDEKDFDNATAVTGFIQQVSQRFDLVMLAERFDESLILMKDLLCWQLEDIISFKQNTRMDISRRPISDSVAKRLRQWNGADQQLYDHFAAEFEKKVQRFGKENMADEVAELRRWNAAWYGQCVQQEGIGTEMEPQYRTWSSKVLGFRLRPNVKSRLCEALAKTEMAFTEQLRARQIKRSKSTPIWGTTFQLFF